MGVTHHRMKDPDVVDEQFAMKKSRVPNAKYKCLTAAGHHVMVHANVNQSIEQIKKLAEKKHKTQVVDVIDEIRSIGATDGDES